MAGCLIVEDTNNDGFKWVTSSSYARTGGTKSAYISYNSTTNTVAMNDWMFTPGITMTAGKSYSVTFWYRGNTLVEKLELKYGTSPASSAMTSATIFTTDINSGTYAQGFANFVPTTSGTYYIGFHGFSDANKWYIAVDDITILETPAPACPTLTALANNATGVSVTTANSLTWTAGTYAASYEVKVSRNADLSNPLISTNVTTTSYSIAANTLTAATKYYWSATDSRQTS
ncbi:MAG: hypothetical protein EOO61_13390 [Hymenobacter sp.]|nr:MAG: hypothetical protein EOO61_13390 [Hymenobacter sp.]